MDFSELKDFLHGHKIFTFTFLKYQEIAFVEHFDDLSTPYDDAFPESY